MKPLKYLLLTCLIATFISCDNDEDTTAAVNPESIVGTWSLSALEADVNLTSSFANLPISSNTRSVGENFDYTVVFTENTYTAEGSYDIVTTGTVNGLPIDTDRQTITDASETGTYSLSNGSIEFGGELFDLASSELELGEFTGDQALNIVFDSNGNLVMTQTLETTVEEEGITVATTIDAEIVLTRN
ncbi:Hypothetical protein I595_3436 [Croceitalea dokdonensis DOKDO 023]|uniref:Uncharacterized protein n=1 Tax=Croceitalea dokdonensis DOKDO 023 TaxID=1300341 RepID=A0A0P7ADC8_9FLAO|nr:lipocalin family protein [Croceitalea dokdonensis]KPM30415.1 Hypothetical protein I595_3436 [Croceitalea dokdonensis DOKDO 023]